MALLLSFSTSLLLLAGAEKPTCAYVEIARPIEGSTEKLLEYRAPGHCERVIGGQNGAAKSRRFGCYSGCGGTKLQYQEFSDEECQDPVVDKMVHRPPKEDRTWSTGPSGPETYLMEFDLGAVRDFDCSLAFCYVMETIEKPQRGQPKLRHLPADRVSCTKSATGFQWTKCMENGDLMLFENEVCDVDSEPTILRMGNDSGKESFAGVVRKWECEGFDVVDSDEDEDFAEHVLLEARLKTQRSAQARREMALANKLARENAGSGSESTGVESSTVLIFLAIAAIPVAIFGFRACHKNRSNLKVMLPMPMSSRARRGYAGLTQGDEMA